MSESTRVLTWSGLPTPLDAASALHALDPALLKLTVEHISTRVAVINRDYCYTYANGEALKFMGLPASSVVGRHMSEILDDGVYQSFLPLLRRLFAGESLHIEGWVEYQRQGRRFREQLLMPFLGADGVAQSIIVCGLDHTEMRLNEQQLHASEALKSAILDHALVALITTDAQGRIVEFNPTAEAMFGHARAEVLGRPVSDVVVPARFRDRHVAGLRRMHEGDVPRVLGKRMELSALRADGSEFPIEMLLWRTEVSGQVFYTSSIVDMSQRQAAEEQIARQRDALRQSEKLSAMGSLLAGVAHELNNPLAIVMGRASLLEEKLEGHNLGPHIQGDLQRIREAAERCGRIVRTFLNMARSRPAQRSSVALHELVRAAADMLAYSYRSHGVELALDLAPDLPPLEADGDQIGQVVLNLLVNAQQALASHDGPRRVHVSSGLDAEQARLWLRVADTGPGVSASARAKLFEPFFTTKAEGSGTGLGLSLSRSLAREHGGELSLEPAVAGSGASFMLSLPILSNAPVAESAPATLPGALAETEPTPLARVLVVDDEAEMSALMREMLEGGGYDVVTASSGAQALELLATGRFAAIVSDLRMPDLDGAAFWRLVGARHPALARRIVFVTGDTLSAEARDFLQGSRCLSLEKPFSKLDLLSRVSRLIG